MSPTLYISILSLAALMLLWIGGFAWRHPTTLGSRTFTGLALMIVVWTLGYLLDWVASTPRLLWLSQQIAYVGVTTIPVITFIFTRQYLGQRIPQRWLWLLFMLPTLSFLMLLTNSQHGLFFRFFELSPGPSKVVFGPYFWAVHIPYSYGLMLVSIVLVLRELGRASGYHRRQLLTLLVAYSLPFATNVLYTSGLTGNISYTPLSFAVVALLLAWSLFRQGLISSKPIAYETVFQTILDAVIVLDRRDIVSDVNPAAAHELGHSREALMGQPAQVVFAPWSELWAQYGGMTELETDIVLIPEQRHLNLRILPLYSNRTLVGRVISLRDITASKLRQHDLETMAFHDPLTSLANRRGFELEAKRTLQQGKPFALLYFDLDDFKRVNDTYGHDAGDELLRLVAIRAQACLRQPDFIARLGGDEFAALLQVDPAQARQIVGRIQESIHEPFKIGEHMVQARLSIGLAFFPEHGTDLADLMRQADAAMYAMKERADDPGPSAVKT